MLVRSLITFCLVLGCTYTSSYAVEDIEFLTSISTKYSPTLVKQLLVSRIDHKLYQISAMNKTIGINQAQKDLCRAIFHAVFTLRSDVLAMNEQQVICGDETYTNTVKSFISQFSMLITMFDAEFETLKTPDITDNNPVSLINMLNSSSYDISDKVANLTRNALMAYSTVIDNLATDNQTAPEIQILGIGIKHELQRMITTIDSWKSVSYTKKDLLTLLERFKEAIDIFYRQVELVDQRP